MSENQIGGQVQKNAARWYPVLVWLSIIVVSLYAVTAQILEEGFFRDSKGYWYTDALGFVLDLFGPILVVLASARLGRDILGLARDIPCDLSVALRVCNGVGISAVIAVLAYAFSVYSNATVVVFLVVAAPLALTSKFVALKCMPQDEYEIDDDDDDDEEDD